MTDDSDGRPTGGPSRRDLLASASVAVAAIAGCPGSGSSGEVPTPARRSPAATGTATGAATDPATGEPSETPSVAPTATRSPTATTAEPTTASPTPTTAPPADASYVYVGGSQLRAVAERVRNEESPWADAYERAMADADRALNTAPRSVVDDGAPEWDDPHRFGTDEERHDYMAALHVTKAVRDAALGYWFTKQDRYAETAIDLCHHWCLDPETRMKPDADVANNGTFVELLVTMPRLWYGASLLDGHPYWTEKNGRDLEAAFEAWVESLVDSFHDPGYFQYNNHWAWRIAGIAGAASYLGDRDLLDRAFCMWRGECETAAHGKDKPRPWNQYRPDGDGTGYLKRELVRTDGLQYHMYGMKALVMTAEIARQHDVDLYGYSAPTDPGDGSTLKKLFDFMVPYLRSPSDWKWGTGSDGLDGQERDSYAALFELAYSRWQDPAHLEVIRTFDRPAYDFWLLGWTSLTHANSFRLDDD